MTGIVPRPAPAHKSGVPAFITASGQCLPGAPVGNAAMADHIGRLSDRCEREGRLTLRQNGIRYRHYAIDATGKTDWTVEGLAAAAVGDVLARAGIDRAAIGHLATATTQNDLMVPGLASAVHAESGLPPLEVSSHQSVCASTMMALSTRRSGCTSPG